MARKRPDPGAMRFQLTLFKPSASTDDVGQKIRSFTQEAIVPCFARNVRGRLTDAGEQEMAGRRTYEFVVRYGSGVDYGWELEYRGERLRVERIDNWDERNRMQIIYAFESDL